MEIIIYILAALIGLLGLFLIIEFPYHFIGFFIFIIHYNYNIELPGPLDLRGWLTVVLFLRLLVFDKENATFIFNFIIKNHLFLLILFFGFYFITVTYFTSNTYLTPIRLFVFQIIGLLIGFIAVYRGYAKESFFYAFIAAGLFSTADLIYHYITSSGSGFLFTRILDMVTKSEYSTEINHNWFGMLIGVAFLTVFVMTIKDQIKKSFGYILLIIFGFGVLFSTSRGTMLALIVALFLSFFILPKGLFNFKKVITYGLGIVLVFIILLSSFFAIIKSLNIESNFSERIYYRLVEEPLSMLGVESKVVYSSKDNIKEGTINWRITKALRDLNEFNRIKLSTQLFGFGYEGYFKIAEKKYDPWDMSFKIISHNGYVLVLIERGVIGFLVLSILYGLLLKTSIKTFQTAIESFPFFIIIIFYLVFTVSAQAELLNRMSYILFGGVIGQSILVQKQNETKANNN